MLVGAVVVGHDGAGADIDALAEARIAHVGQVVRFRGGTEARVLHLDEVADVHSAAQGGGRAQARERPDVAAGTDERAVDHAVREHPGVGADLAVADHAARTHAHPVTEHHPALEHHVDVDEYVRAVGELAAHVQARGIGECHARQQQRARAPRSPYRFQLRELRLVVHPQHFTGLRRNERPDRDLVPHRHGDDVGEIVLGGRVVRLQSRQPAAQQLRGAGEHPGVAFADGALRWRRVLLLDDPLHEPPGAAHDAAVALRIVSLHGEQRQPPRPRERHELGELGATDERHVSIEHQHQVLVGDVLHRLQHGVPGAQALGLQRPGDRLVLECGGHLLAPVPVNHLDGGGRERARRVDHVLQQRPAGERLQHLRQSRLHALALPGRQDHHRQRGGTDLARSAAACSPAAPHSAAALRCPGGAHGRDCTHRATVNER